jgi:hypothetical protein
MDGGLRGLETMGSITLNKPSGGQLTLTPEDGTSTETVSIPSVGVGKVLQVLTYQHDSGTITTTSDGNVSTGISLTITPKATDSKIICTLTGGFQTFSSTSVQGVTSIYRSINGGTFSNLDYIDAFYAATGDWIPHSGQYVDTTFNTTAPVTYTVYMRSRSSLGTYYFHQDVGGVSGTMVFTLMEVAA